MKDFEKMYAVALANFNNAYAPYSHFKVGACVLLKNGEMIGGCNVENASYGATVCAERSAILSAISAGYKKGDFKELYVMVDSDKISSCCFLCRQVISELFDKDADIILMNRLGDVETYKVEDLCPKPFDEGDLI